MKLFRCQICGDPMLLMDKPTCCPFCGAHHQHIVVATQYSQPPTSTLSDMSRANLSKALDVEVSNAKFYKCASDKATDETAKQLFRALAKIETEHASTISKALGISRPGVDAGTDDCYGTVEENFDDAKSRETRASEFYRQAAGDASEERVAQIFNALIEVEADHLQILTAMREQALV